MSDGDPIKGARRAARKQAQLTEKSIESRFKKGVSGNPAGRPRNPRTPAQYLGDVLEAKVVVTIDGKQKKVTSLQAILMTLSARAMRGDPKAAGQLLNWIDKIGYHPDPIDLMKWWRKYRDQVPPDQRRNMDSIFGLLDIAAVLEDLGLLFQNDNRQYFVEKDVLSMLFEGNDGEHYREKIHARLKEYYA